MLDQYKLNVHWQKTGFQTAKFATDDIHVWTFSLSTLPTNIPKLNEILSPAELARGQDKKQQVDQQRYLLAHIALRMLLGHYLTIDPTVIQFNRNQHGKPYILSPQQPNLYFNLSHSGDWVVIALSMQTELGVDIEQIKPRRQLEKIINKYFSITERQALNDAQPQQYLPLFYQYWTLKEALIKGKGDKLSNLLASTDTNDNAAQFDIEKTAPNNHNWRLISIPGIEHHAIALAYQNKLLPRPTFKLFQYHG